MYKHVAAITLSLNLLSSQNLMAFDDSGLIENNQQGISHALQGVVFDRTITQSGLQFYQSFTRLWQMETLAHNYSLTIRETPSARYGSIIHIEQGSRRLAHLNIGMRNRQIDHKASQSLKQIKTQLRGSELPIF